jgi:MFS family permease
VDSTSQAQVRPGRAGIATLLFSMIAIGMGHSLIFALIPVLGRELALHDLAVQLPWSGQWQPRELVITSLSAVTALVAAQTAPIWGRFSDRVGRRVIILYGLGGYTIGGLIFASAGWAGMLGLVVGWGAYLALLLARLIHALLMSATLPAATAYVVDITTAKQRTRGVGKLNAANQTGMMMGPLLMSAASIHLLLPMVLQAVMTALALVLAWRFLPDTGVRVTRRSGVRLRYFDARFRPIIIAAFCTYAMMGGVVTTLAFYFQDLLGLTPVQAGQRFAMAMAFASAAMVFSQLVLMRFIHSPLKLLLTGLPVLALGLFAIAGASNLHTLWAGMVGYGLGMGLSMPAFSSGASLTVLPQEQGSLAGIISSMGAWGFLVGPLAGGALYAMKPSLPYWCAAVLVVFLTGYLWSQRRRVPA